MSRRPTRLFIIKFLGLWTSSNQPAANQETDENKASTKERLSQILSLQREGRANGPDVELSSSNKSAEINSFIDTSNKAIVGFMLEKGVPGLTICVSKGGQTIWQAAFGFCDVENQLICEPDARMRIASISKPLFVATVVAPMIEQGHVNIKSSIHKFLTSEEFPKQKFEGKEYDITIEELLSHTAGIRHYDDSKREDNPLRPICSKGTKKIYQCDDQYNREGFYQRHTYRNVIDALKPFKEGPLVQEPGKFFYTTYGYTLLSAVMQKIHQSKENGSKEEQIEDYWVKTLHQDWNMRDTHLDQDEVIIPKRARYYLRTSLNGELINAPYQDSSVKWAGGGIVSTTSDLVKFGNSLIDCYKGRESAKLKRETIELLWKEVKSSYGLGFMIKSLAEKKNEKKFAIYHLGGALGASSALIIYPESEIVVAILTNLGYVNLRSLGLLIADALEKLK